MNDLITLTLAREQLEQIKVDVEGAIQELTELSREVDWFATDIPDRLQMALVWLEEARQ